MKSIQWYASPEEKCSGRISKQCRPVHYVARLYSSFVTTSSDRGDLLRHASRVDAVIPIKNVLAEFWAWVFITLVGCVEFAIPTGNAVAMKKALVPLPRVDIFYGSGLCDRRFLVSAEGVPASLMMTSAGKPSFTGSMDTVTPFVSCNVSRVSTRRRVPPLRPLSDPALSN